MQANAANEPWYRNYLVWLVIAIPLLTVLGCMLTIYLAVSNPETLVNEPSKFPPEQAAGEAPPR